MRKLFIAIATILMFSFVPLSAYVVNGNMSNDSEKVSESFDKSISEIINSKKAKGAVATLIQNGEVVMTNGYGYADEFLNVKADGTLSGFRIGSISKTFVAVAALKAMEDGKLDLNTDISIYLGKNSPKLKYPVTMQNLLTHTAGFEEIVTGMAVENVSDTEPLSETTIKYAPEQISKPGEFASYSNYGIALAAYVIECATNEDFSDYCMNNIFLPLGMNRTTFEYMHNKVIVSKAYLPNGKETLDLYMNLYPEGSVVTTAEDMGKYIQWLLGERKEILQNENKEKLFSRQYFMADELSGIGYVWNRKTRNDSLYLEKKGETLHFYSRIVLYPEYKTGLFLSFNTYVPEEEINDIISKVTDLILGEKIIPVSKSGATLDISGCYVNAWSSFNTAEKLLRFIVPDKMIDISGSLKEGYTFNDEKITHIGNNSYDTPIGLIKFTEKNGEVLMMTDFSQYYTKINGLENKGVTLTIVLLFLMSAIICTITSFILRKKPASLLFGIISLVQIILLFTLGYVLYLGILQYAILNYIIYIKATTWLIVAATAINVIFLLIKHENNTNYIKYIYFHNIISIAFCIMMFNLNLLV